jgi:hypothetical protein
MMHTYNQISTESVVSGFRRCSTLVTPANVAVCSMDCFLVCSEHNSPKQAAGWLHIYRNIHYNIVQKQRRCLSNAFTCNDDGQR